MTPAAHVLIVDDDQTSSRASAEQVRSLGYDVTVAHEWTGALDAFGQIDVDLVLMDAVMPTVDGFRLTGILRARAREYVPIVFLTSLSDPVTRLRSVEIGADDFIVKPADPLELQLRLQAMLRIRTLTRALEREHKAMERLASIDALTGLGNRRAFDARLIEGLELYRRSGTSVSLLLLDIDHFKAVNDRHGHQRGDEILSDLGGLLSRVTRDCDRAYRYGGEEFAVIATTTRSQEAVLIAERIRDAFARVTEATPCGSQTLSIGVCGVEQLAVHGTCADFVAAADAALYRAKADGRDRVRQYDGRRDKHETGASHR